MGPALRVLMVAPPGAGKGTQGALIGAHFSIPHIASGDLLRDHVARRTELGRAVQRHLDDGTLVPDELVLDMVRQIYREVTHPIVAWYGARGILVSVDAMRPPSRSARRSWPRSR